MMVCGGRIKLPNDLQCVDLLAKASPRDEDEDNPAVPPNIVDDEGRSAEDLLDRQ